jgi:hypothetical protein
MIPAWHWEGIFDILQAGGESALGWFGHEKDIGMVFGISIFWDKVTERERDRERER